MIWILMVLVFTSLITLLFVLAKISSFDKKREDEEQEKFLSDMSVKGREDGQKNEEA